MKAKKMMAAARRLKMAAENRLKVIEENKYCQLIINPAIKADTWKRGSEKKQW
jgi:hypothetical protein